MNYNYTEEHYAEMYNNLPEGLKDLVLSGRLAIQVSAIGNRHGLNADQVADLEPAVEDVCLGLILKTQLAENIKTQVGVDDRVANRIAAEVEIEILRPFEPELIIARQQKEDLDKKIANPKTSTQPTNTQPIQTTQPAPGKQAKEEFVPKDISEKSNVAAIKNFYNSGNTQTSDAGLKDSTDLQDATKPTPTFNWDDLGKKKEVPQAPASPISQQPETSNKQPATMSVDEKIDKLTDTINKLVMDRFGGEKKDEGLSEQMKELMKRLEVAEKENQENKKLIQKLQGDNHFETLQKNQSGSTVNSANVTQNIFDLPKDANKINVDKPRSVNIDKTKSLQSEKEDISGNVKVVSTTQNPIPITKKEVTTPETQIHSSIVSQATADTIVETRNKQNENIPVTESTKKVLSLDELLKKNDDKIKNAKPTTAQIVFPTIGTEKKVDIKNVAQADGLRQTLMEDINFLKKKNESQTQNSSADQMTNVQQNIASKSASTTTATTQNSTATDPNTQNDQTQKDLQNLTSNQTSVTLDQFKDELVPKTKEDRMRALQDKIKSMNKGVTTGGANSIAASALDPYKL